VAAAPTAAPVSTTPPTAAPTVAPSATPVPPTQEEIRTAAAAAYLAAVKPYNRTNDRLWKQYKNKTSLKALRTYCSKKDVNLRTWIEKLQGITMPDDTRADAKQLIRWAAAEDVGLRQCAAAKTWAEWDRGWARFDRNADRATEYANLVRLDLGLPPVPV
jgi:hypothetical protein